MGEPLTIKCEPCRIEPFHWLHAAHLQLAEFDASSLAGLNVHPVDFIRGLAASGPFYSLISPDSEIVCIAGISLLYGFGTDVGEAWVGPGLPVPRYRKAFHIAVSGMLNWLIKEMGIRRLQCKVAVGHPTSHRWTAGKNGDGKGACLGFRREAYLEGIGPAGQDYIQYVKIRGKDF